MPTALVVIAFLDAHLDTIAVELDLVDPIASGWRTLHRSA
jgi:hypothetical protein